MYAIHHIRSTSNDHSATSKCESNTVPTTSQALLTVLIGWSFFALPCSTRSDSHYRHTSIHRAQREEQNSGSMVGNISFAPYRHGLDGGMWDEHYVHLG